MENKNLKDEEMAQVAGGVGLLFDIDPSDPRRQAMAGRVKTIWANIGAADTPDAVSKKRRD